MVVCLSQIHLTDYAIAQSDLWCDFWARCAAEFCSRVLWLRKWCDFQPKKAAEDFSPEALQARRFATSGLGIIVKPAPISLKSYYRMMYSDTTVWPRWLAGLWGCAGDLVCVSERGCEIPLMRFDIIWRFLLFENCNFLISRCQVIPYDKVFLLK